MSGQTCGCMYLPISSNVSKSWIAFTGANKSWMPPALQRRSTPVISPPQKKICQYHIALSYTIQFSVVMMIYDVSECNSNYIIN